MIPGDYDRDGMLDNDDFGMWQAQFGSTGKQSADGNGDGLVNAADYAIWRDRAASQADAAANNEAAVPEPSLLAVLLILSLAGAVGRTARAL